MKTLAELAALAEEKVPGFKRPEAARCWECGNEMGYCACSKDELDFDNSPTALLMAVVQCSLEFHALEHEIVFVRGVRGGKGAGRAAIDATGAPNDDIARAALVALLRAHGVEVDNG